MQRIKKGDEVVIIAGKDKGRRGTVSHFITKKGKCRAVVEGLNLAKKHTKPNPQANVQGGIVDKEMPIDLSNLMLFNPKTEKGSRVGFRVDEDGKKYRFFRSTGEKV
jgi:large subunit ribosomal protein L24